MPNESPVIICPARRQAQSAKSVAASSMRASPRLSKSPMPSILRLRQGRSRRKPNVCQCRSPKRSQRRSETSGEDGGQRPVSGANAARDGDRRDQEHRDSDYDLNDHRMLPRTSAASLPPRRSLRAKGFRAARFRLPRQPADIRFFPAAFTRGPGATPAGHV